MENEFQVTLPMKKKFKGSAIYYENALNNAGCINELVSHTPTTRNQENKNKIRQGNIIWFDSLNIKNVTMRIGQSFLIDNRYPFPKKSHF